MMTDEEWDEVYTKGFEAGFKIALEKLVTTAEPLGRLIDESDFKYITINMLKAVIEEISPK